MKIHPFIALLFFAACQSTKPVDLYPRVDDAEDSDNLSTMFAAGKIKTNNGISFSKDGGSLLVSIPTERKFSNGKQMMGLLEYQYVDSAWQIKGFLNFGLGIDAYHPVLSISNDTLYFNSRSDINNAEVAVPHDIWYVEKKGNQWGQPIPHPVINSSVYDSYPSIAKNGNIYFNSDRSGGLGRMDIYVSILDSGKHQPPINLSILNSEEDENDLVVDPDERFLIFNRYEAKSKSIDLYISYRHGELWTKPVALSRINRDDRWELTPTLSPDGKYFYYEVEGKIWKIKLSDFIDIN